MNPEIAVQLVRIGIEVVTVRDLQLLGDSDLNHLKRAVCCVRKIAIF